ncbi:MAG: hypothetical protein N3C58_06185 [Meiothermus ruber]|jgi:hypothetical protein|uniref:VCBS repeat-containing protein n=1 Tax=Meiothermus ruber TaxID=277 RepID=A0A7C3HSU7_MEIRU|nr:hypothetical protein [Meiothermus ruber]
MRVQISASALVLFGLVLAQPASNSPIAWGSYTVRQEPGLLRIIRADRTQVEIKGERFEVKQVELTGQAPAELWINETSGPHSTSYFFTQEQGFRNLLIYRGRTAGVLEIRDVDNDRRPEIIVGTDVFADFGGLPREVYPRLTYILAWDGVRYVDATTRFPTLGFRTLSYYRTALQDALVQKDEVNARSAALGYYGRGLITGQADEAKKWLMANTPQAIRRWLLDLEGEVIRAIYADLACRLTVSYSKKLPPKPVCNW